MMEHNRNLVLAHILANATSYGIFIEINVEEEDAARSFDRVLILSDQDPSETLDAPL